MRFFSIGLTLLFFSSTVFSQNRLPGVRPVLRTVNGQTLYDFTFPPPGNASAYSYLIESSSPPILQIVEQKVERVTSSHPGDVTRPLFETEFLGKMRDIPLYRITFHPYRANQTETEWTTQLTLRMAAPSGSTRLKEPLANESRLLLDKYSIGGTARRLTAQKFSSVVTQSASTLPAQYVKLTIDSNGIYKIRYTDLADSTRLDFRNVDPRTFRLFNRSVEVPMYFQGDGDGSFDREDYFEFYGEQNRARNNPYLRNIPTSQGHTLDPWTDDNVYMLTWNERNGLRLIDENAGVLSSNTVDRFSNFLTTVHEERDNVRLAVKNIILGRPAAEEDIWAFDEGLSIVLGTGRNLANYTFTLDELETQFPNDVYTLRINLQGVSTGRHEVSFFLNEFAVGAASYSWNGASKFQLDLDVPAGSFRSGENILRLETRSSQDRPLDEFALNWFEVTYKKRYRATRDYLEFKKGTDARAGFTPQYTLTQFSDFNISVYKKGISRLVNWNLRQDPTTGLWSVILQDEANLAETEYVAVTEARKRRPKRIQLRTNSGLQSTPHNARYLIITDTPLLAAAQEYKAYRESTGFTVEIVTVEDIYDEFGGGIKSPYAIRDFLRYTYTSPMWSGTQGSPLYVLLMGDGSNKPSRNIGEIIPIQFIQTQSYGASPSDHWYALVDDQDILPDFYIGRLAVTSVSEVRTILAKIRSYEDGIAGQWKNRIQFIGGSAESRGIGSGSVPRDVFRFQTNSLVNVSVPTAFSPNRIFAYPRNDANVGGANEVIQSLSQGNLVTCYLGHGGGGIWGDIDVITGKPLLDTNQVRQVTNTAGNLPFIMSMTCFVGAFDDGSPLGEYLLETPNRGAIGVYASSGTGWIVGDFQLLQQTADPLLTPGSTIGAALAQGKINYLTFKGITDVETSGSGNMSATAFVPQSMVHMFTLLGDPGLRLPVPQSSTVSVSNLSPSSTETVTVSGTAPFSAGSGQLEIFQTKTTLDSVPEGGNIASYQTLAVFPFTLSGASYSVPVNLSSVGNLSDGLAGVRLFIESSDGSAWINASTAFAVNATYLAELTSVPASPTSSDVIHFEASVSDPQGIASVVAIVDMFGTVNAVGVVDTMDAIGAGRYRSRGVGPLGENDIVRYRVRVFDGNGDSTTSGLYEIRVRAGIDLTLGVVDFLDPQTTRISIGGTTSTQIEAVIENKGFSSLSNVVVRFYENDPRSGGVLLGETLANVTGAIDNADRPATDTVSIASTLTNGFHEIWVWIDPDSALTDINRNNNLGYANLQLNVFNVTVPLGTTLSGTQNDTVFIDDGLRLNIPQNTVSQNSAVRIWTDDLPITHQPDLGAGIPLGASVPVSYRIQFLSPVSFGGTPVTLMLQYDTTTYPSAYRDSFSVYRYDATNQRWRLLGRDRSELPGTVAIEVRQPDDLTRIALIINRDNVAPKVEPIVEGQFFTQNAIVPRRPKISAILSDPNGVDIRKERLLIAVDNRPIKPNEIIMADSLLNSNVATLTLALDQPDFTAGAHAISFQAYDLSGNLSEPSSIFFQVVEEFKVHVFGTFPNPFKTSTTFAFRTEAAEPLDDLTISVYTVDGRRIRKIDPQDVGDQVLTSIGYHEVVWDAMDDGGHPVANGIYFYKIRAKLNGKIIERKGKLAFFR